MNTLKIKKMVIQGIGGITNLTLPFKDELNLICGTNGIGKTTILECISHTFIQTSTTKLKKTLMLKKEPALYFSWKIILKKKFHMILLIPILQEQQII